VERELLRFTVRGVPQPQPRTRVRGFIRQGRPSGQTYDPGTADDWKALVALAARPHLPPVPFTGPLSLFVRFRFPRPKGHYGSGRFQLELRPKAPRRWCFGRRRNDFDNMAKAVADVLTAVRCWEDDSHVARAVTELEWADHSGAAGCVVVISQLEDDDGDGK